MKRAISLRAKADRKARRYTKLLSDAIDAAEDAAMQMNELTQIYGLDVSTYTLLTQALHANSG
jgi:DNA-binding ferritin-like protein (Dps family)